MSTAGGPPERRRAQKRRRGVFQKVFEDPDVRSSARFLKVIGLRVTTVTLAVCIVGAVVACREGVQNKIRPRHGNAAAYPRRSGLAAFFQELVTQPFLKLAH